VVDVAEILTGIFHSQHLILSQLRFTFAFPPVYFRYAPTIACTESPIFVSALNCKFAGRMTFRPHNQHYHIIIIRHHSAVLHHYQCVVAHLSVWPHLFRGAGHDREKEGIWIWIWIIVARSRRLSQRRGESS